MVAASPLFAHVVIVDKSSDSCEVLQTTLTRRGVSTMDVRDIRDGVDLVRSHRPAVAVVDLDAVRADEEHWCEILSAAARDSDTALVVLGKIRQSIQTLPQGQVIAKPYHYAPLIRTIERLLERSSA